MESKEFRCGKLSLETFSGESSKTSTNDYLNALTMDSSKHASFSFLVYNQDVANGIICKVEVSNNPNDATPVWATYQDEAVVSALTTLKVSGVTVSNAVRISTKSQSAGNHAAFVTFGRLNPTLIF